jgi:hypothetical protein
VEQLATRSQPASAESHQIRCVPEIRISRNDGKAILFGVGPNTDIIAASELAIVDMA